MRSLHPVWFVVCVLLVGGFAHADRPAKARAKAAIVVARVVGLEIYDGAAVVTIAAGSEQGFDHRWHAKFREGDTAKPLAGGDATIIRVDRRTSVLKAELTAAQVRANRFIQLEP